MEKQPSKCSINKNEWALSESVDLAQSLRRENKLQLDPVPISV